MKLISVLAVAVLLASTSFAMADDPRARPGGYNEQVANKKSLASCVADIAVKDSLGNITGYHCH
jgi:hypothetical protein